MATVTLTAVWIANTADLSTSVQGQTLSIVETPTVTGSVRSYANGRQRVVANVAKPRSVQMQFTLMAASDVALLKSWVGQAVLVRDPYGLKMYAAYFSLGRTQQIVPNINEVTVTFQEVTVSEAV